MIKKYSIWSCLIILLSLKGFSQNLTVNNQALFGTVNELTTDSTQITITNNTGKTVTINGYRFYTIYSNYPFSTFSGNYVIPNGSTQNLWIRFNPKHNILNNSEVVIFNDSHLGPLHVDLRGQGHYSNTYYNASENLEEEALKLQLQTTTGQNYHALGYSANFPNARDKMFEVIDNKKTNGQGATQNTLECVYTGRTAVGYIDRADCQTTYSFNTEHTFPQNFFNSNEPEKSDLYHLFPTDDDANNKRASLPFGVVTTPTWTNGGSKLGNGVFEPRDVHKGEVARAMFYFVTRYQNYSNFLDTQEAILRQWNASFPVTAIEQKRCADIYGLQFNRNPFIDYPQLIDRITSFSSTSVAVANYSLDVIENNIDYATVNVGGSYVYQYLIVNKGNQAVNFSNFSLSSPELAFQSPFTGANVSIQPGDALAVLVRFTPTQAGGLAETLSFNSDVPSQVNFYVPVTANITTGIADVNGKDRFNIYPNPFTDQICINPVPSTKAKIRLYDLQGRNVEVLNGSMFQSCSTISDKLTPGTYVIEVQEGNVPVRQLIIKQ